MLNSSKMTFQNGVSSATKAQLFVPITQTDHNKPIKIVSFSPAQNDTQNGTQNGTSFSPVFPGCYVDIAPGYPGIFFPPNLLRIDLRLIKIIWTKL